MLRINIFIESIERAGSYSAVNTFTYSVTPIKKPLENQGVNFNLADRTGLEPATSAVTGRHSNQLNYRSSVDALTSISGCKYKDLYRIKNPSLKISEFCILG